MIVDPTSDLGRRILAACRAAPCDDVTIDIDEADGTAYVWLWGPNRDYATHLQTKDY